MSIVYVVQENPRVDILSATKYGELLPLANPSEQLHLSPGRIISLFKRIEKMYYPVKLSFRGGIGDYQQ